MKEYCTVTGFSFKNNYEFFKSVPCEDAITCMGETNKEHGTHLFKILHGVGEDLTVRTFWWGDASEFSSILFLDPQTLYVVKGERFNE